MSKELPDDYRINELLTRAVTEVLPSQELLIEELRSGKKLNAYLGIDPTGAEMHLGHLSQLYKLRRLQDLGHQSILLIGDFTAMIGDPTDKSAARVKLTREEVLVNAQTYKEQAAKILDFDNPANPVQFRYNSEWLSPMSFADVLELASEFTVQQMSARDMFQRRMGENKPVHLHEFLYPLMQGWDSVNLKVDIEIGGSDQIFNMMIGRDLVRRHLNKSKFVIAGKLLEDPSGKKIGKTEGNMITLVDTPVDMFHKVMLWGDEIVPHALELCTSMPMEEVHDLEKLVRGGQVSPLESKIMLARRIVTELHSAQEAIHAEDQYNTIKKGQSIEQILSYTTKPGSLLIDVLVNSGLAISKSEARRLISQGGVRVDGNTVNEVKHVLDDSEELTIQVGKKTSDSYRRIILK